MPKVPRNNALPMLIKISNAFGGHARYSSSQGGAFVRIGTPPYHVDIYKGDSIVKKGGKAIITKFYIQQKIAYVKKYPELHYMIDGLEKLLKQTIKIEKG